MKYLLILLFLFSSNSFAGVTRSIDADQIQSGTHSLTWTMPSATGTLVQASNIPVSGQYVRDSFTANSSTTVFALSFSVPNNTEPMIFLDGILQILTTDYTLSGTTLTFVTAPTTGQTIKVQYSKF